jgi:hypothetical protein
LYGEEQHLQQHHSRQKEQRAMARGYTDHIESENSKLEFETFPERLVAGASDSGVVNPKTEASENRNSNPKTYDYR